MVRLKALAAEEDYKQQIDFNSTMVRLKENIRSRFLMIARISIPLWYD